MKINYHIIKIIIAVPIAVFIAEWFGLNYSGSAGIIAVLCIQSTRKKSFLIAWHRLAAGLLSIVFSYFIFGYLGYSPLTVGLLLLLFLPTANVLKVSPGIVTSLVILFHFYSDQSVAPANIMNEIYIMVIGIGVALILNLYIPDLDKKIEELKNEIELNYQLIFRRFAEYLSGEIQSLPIRELNELREQLDDGEKWVQDNIENTFSRSAQKQQKYFSMRKVQIDSLDQMLKLIEPLNVPIEQSYKLADVYTDLADTIYPNNTVAYHLDQVEWLKSYFRKGELPETRREFEIRASLFQLLSEIEHYLTIKNRSITEDCA